ncbi:MAG: FAD-dependent oxidoreductase [candidate division NC10 bacterium]|nr:FAD-dependent oxidoreductase [candidate division NC10 bacterium]
MTNYLILGNGVAGLRAAEVIRRNDRNGKITMLSHEPHPFYYRPQLADFVAGRVKEDSLFARGQEFYEKQKIATLFGKRAKAVLPKKKEVVMEDGKKVDYDRLLLAPGCRFQLPSWAAGRPGVYTLKTLEDAKQISKVAAKSEKALVVGEGLFGLEMARGLREKGLKVSYLLRGERFWPEVLDEVASGLVISHLRSRGIEVLPNEEVKEIWASNGKVQGVMSSKDRLILGQLIGVGVDFRPDVEFLKESGIQLGKGILTDDHLRTNYPNIFGAGDAAQVFDAYRGEAILHFGWQSAWEQGAIAGSNMSGGDLTYSGRIPALSIQIYGLDFLSLGEGNPQAPGYKGMTGDYPEMGIYKKLVLKEDRVVGALLLGSISEATPIEDLIRNRAEISQVDKKLLMRVFDLHYWISSGLEVLCPVCKLNVKLSEKSKEGDLIACPICGVEFKLSQMNGRFRAVNAGAKA